MKTPKGIYNERDFRITMVADSTNETWADIPTGIKSGQAWKIHAVEYIFENIDPTVPLQGLAAGGQENWVLQIHRNTNHETLLSFNDMELLLHDDREAMYLTSGFGMFSRTFRTEKTCMTTRPKLRAMFRSYNDMGVVSQVTSQIAGKLYYEVTKGPKTNDIKLGDLEAL